MKKILVVSIIIVWTGNLLSQTSVDLVLKEVEKNNTSLMAMRKTMDAEKIGNKTGLYLPNPEVEFNYLWGNPSAIGNRTDFSVKQSFDFPTAYGYKSQISELKNEQAELEYSKHRSEILHQTRVICAKLIYHNALHRELNLRYTNARSIADAYEARLKAGDVGVIEYNKAQINLLNVKKELESNEIEQNALLLELAALNGGLLMDFTDTLFSNLSVPSSFEQWFASVEAGNPELQWMKHETAIASGEVKLSTAMNLPKLQAGYMSETVIGQQFQGVTVGITIPVWENKHTVTYARARSNAVQSLENDARSSFYLEMKARYSHAVALQTTIDDFRSKLVLYGNSELLDKAFKAGEISLSEYMYELSFYYESIQNLLEMELKLNLTLLELYKYHVR